MMTPICYIGCLINACSCYTGGGANRRGKCFDSITLARCGVGLYPSNSIALYTSTAFSGEWCARSSRAVTISSCAGTRLAASSFCSRSIAAIRSPEPKQAFIRLDVSAGSMSGCPERSWRNSCTTCRGDGNGEPGRCTVARTCANNARLSDDILNGCPVS